MEEGDDSDTFEVIKIIEMLPDNVEKVLYHRFIHYHTRKAVLQSFSSALDKVMRLHFLGESLELLCRPADFKFENDLALPEISKDELQTQYSPI